MPTNVSSNNCSFPIWYWSSVEKLRYFSNYIFVLIFAATTVVPSYFVAVAFCRKYRHVVSFVYQRIYICHTCLHGTTGVVYIFFLRHWSGSLSGTAEGTIWFRSQYGLMWYTCHICGPLQSAAGILSLLLLCAMAVDRLLAVTVPLFYRSLNHKASAVGLTVISALLAVGFTVFDVPRFTVGLNAVGLYQCQAEPTYSSQKFLRTISACRNIFDILAVAGVVLVNIVTFYYFGKRSRNVGKGVGVGVDRLVNKRYCENRKLARVLLKLTFSQSIVVLFNKPPIIVWHFLAVFQQPVYDCYTDLISVTIEILGQLCHVLHFFALFIFNQPFRCLLFDLPFLRRYKSSIVSRFTV